MKNKINRRQFLKKSASTTAAAMAFPYIIPSSALGKAGSVSASNRIVIGFIGAGRIASKRLIPGMLNEPGTQVVAVCDVEKLKVKAEQEAINSHYAGKTANSSYKGCDGYTDFRQLLARDDIDAVVIATPDHWHAVMVDKAAKAGKDIYCEKPLSLTIAEGRAMVNAVRRYGRVFQTGSMQRSDSRFRHACELVRNGYIGEVKKVEVSIGGLGTGFFFAAADCDLPAEPVPGHLDWDMWLGPAPYRPYNHILAHVTGTPGWGNWRSYYDYSGGQITDWGAHHLDIAQWGLGMDHSGPVEIIPPDSENPNRITYLYENGIPVTFDDGKRQVLFVGTKGTVSVGRSHIRTTPESLAHHPIGPNEIRLYKSDNHYGNWLDSIRRRTKPICDVEIGARSVTVCHLGNIATRLGRALKWNPQKEQFVNDVQADRFLDRAKRSPWNL